ncbi:RNA polymerase sigma factor (sigma-70 family) [Prosthecobacter fusiformis]|uniref:RNA polymerase sigma factor (Sigma-70 family) n=1 Tax=Prosthecobacter fusiformis TaxID=48464 RepID=A0A4V3FES2_9BACT|nr:sigma-70 family RNA polymerase sigma factor [Prosthecobacter fusiformis]TDU68053.1 RNA polymerase sigma factor (sigma-70 family) [Prosthecobacter fusiformis]
MQVFAATGHLWVNTMNAMPTHPIDEELAMLGAGKTAAACEKIVAQHGSLVKSACLRVLRDEGLAEDAAQETFMLLIKKASSLPPSTPLAGWLYHAACRTALNHQRAAIRRRARENSIELMNQMIPDAQPNPWTEIEPHLDEAMLTLPPRQRDLVVQCYFQNRTQRSAAAALGCSESVVSRELGAALEALRQFFTRRHVAVSAVALAALLPAHAASASMAGGTALVTAMVAAPASTSLVAALLTSKVLLTTAVMTCTLTVAAVGYHLTTSGSHGSDRRNSSAAGAVAADRGSPNKMSVGVAKKGTWEARFEFTSAMALEERKKQVLLESDPDARYALLQQMGVGLSRAGFDKLIAQGMDASVAPWRDTFAVLENRTDMFDNYLMAWSNENPLAALNWVASQPDGGLGMRKQLLYALEAGQFQPDTLREWISNLKKESMQKEAALALEWLDNPSSLIARLGTGGNDGFLVDLAMLRSGERLDWAAFGSRLGAGKSAIVARAMRQVLDSGLSLQTITPFLQGLATSADPHISVGAVTLMRAAYGQADVDYRVALGLAADCEKAGMGNYKISVFKGWAVADPEAALQYTARLKDLASMRHVLSALSPLPDDTTLVAMMAGTPPVAQDIALAALYSRSTEGLSARLQRIMESTTVVDQVEAAKEVLRNLPFADAPAAAQWLKQQPAGKSRQEMALALSRRLAAVDPQTALELILSEGLSGREYDEAMSHAVKQFSAQNDMEQSTRFIQQITDPTAYADALGQIAMVKFAGRPQEAYAYLQKHSRGDWQLAALQMLSELQYNKLGNIDANAAEILKLDLPKMGPDVAKRASNFCRVWIDHQVPVTTPLAWTQQLPSPMGRATRLQLARRNELKPATLEQFHTWTQTASISQAERAQLQTVLQKRLADPRVK